MLHNEFTPNAFITLSNIGGIELMLNSSNDGVFYRFNYGQANIESEEIFDAEIRYTSSTEDDECNYAYFNHNEDESIAYFLSEANFSKGNKRFFNDVKYSIMYVKGNPYLLTYTAGFSDMFGREKSYFYTAKPIDKETLKIGFSIEKNGSSQFKDKETLKDYINNRIN